MMDIKKYLKSYLVLFVPIGDWDKYEYVRTLLETTFLFTYGGLRHKNFLGGLDDKSKSI